MIPDLKSVSQPLIITASLVRILPDRVIHLCLRETHDGLRSVAPGH